MSGKQAQKKKVGVPPRGLDSICAIWGVRILKPSEEIRCWNPNDPARNAECRVRSQVVGVAEGEHFFFEHLPSLAILFFVLLFFKISKIHGDFEKRLCALLEVFFGSKVSSFRAEDKP